MVRVPSGGETYSTTAALDGEPLSGVSGSDENSEPIVLSPTPYESSPPATAMDEGYGVIFSGRCESMWSSRGGERGAAAQEELRTSRGRIAVAAVSGRIRQHLGCGAS